MHITLIMMLPFLLSIMNGNNINLIAMFHNIALLILF